MSGSGWTRAAAGAVAAMISASAHASAPMLQFDQPAGALGPALESFAARAGLSLIFADGDVARQRAPALHGRFTLNEGLGRLLLGSGLVSRPFGANGVVVFSAGRRAVPESESAVATATLAEVVVTATRQPSLAQQTPIALSVEAGRSLAEIGFDKPAEIARASASLAVQPTLAGQQRFILRGVTGPGEATVGLYYDETPVAGPAGTAADPGATSPQLALVDVDRVEVLRGPQGVRYGAGAMGGAVRILFSPAELHEAAGEVGVAVSSVAGGGLGRELTGVLNQPVVSDHIALRLVAYDLDEPGYVDEQVFHRRDTDEGERRGVRLRLDAKAGEFSLSWTAAYQQGRYGGPVSVIDGLGRGLDARSLATPFADDLFLTSGVGRWRRGALEGVMAVSYSRWSQLRTLDYTRVLSAQAGDPAGCSRYFALGSALSCGAAQQTVYADYVAGRLPQLLRQPMLTEAATVEVRLSRIAAQGVRWNLGAFYEDRGDRIDSQSVRGDAATGELTQPLDLQGFRRIRQGLRQGAVFADFDVPLGLGVRLDVGGRAFSYERRAYGDVLVPNIISGSIASTPARETQETGATGLLVVSRAFSRNIYAYAQLAQGFRPGGVNVVPGLSEDEISFRADRTLNRELGIKTSWLGGKVTANVALYHIDWTGVQSGATTTNGSFGFLTNVGDAKIDGQEFDLAAGPFAGLTLKAEAAFSDARLSDDPMAPAALVPARRGDPIPFAPGRRFTASARYARRLGAEMTGFIELSGDYSGVSHSQFDTTAPYDLKMGGYGVARLAAGITRGATSLDLIVDNLLDRRGRALAQGSAFASEQVVYARPLSLQARITRRW